MDFGDNDFDYDEGFGGEGNETQFWKITKPNALAKYIGKLVAEESGFTVKDMKKLISVKQIKGYVEEVAEKDEDGGMMVNQQYMQDICDLVHGHLVGFDLTKAAAEGMLECYWDDTENTMMFKAIEGHNIEEPPEEFFREMEKDDDE